MNLHTLIEKYGLTDKDMDAIVTGLMAQSSLKAIADSLDVKVDEKKVFVIANAYCREELGEAIDDVSPVIVADRISLREMEDPAIQEKQRLQKEIARLKAINEDLMLWESERKLKLTA